jgi:hypothetical protein
MTPGGRDNSLSLLRSSKRLLSQADAHLRRLLSLRDPDK